MYVAVQENLHTSLINNWKLLLSMFFTIFLLQYVKSQKEWSRKQEIGYCNVNISVLLKKKKKTKKNIQSRKETNKQQKRKPDINREQSAWRMKVLINVHTFGFGLLLQDIWVPGQIHGRNWNVCYIGSRKIYLKLLLLSFNHVNIVMGVFTCHKPKAFVCVFIKLVYHCIKWMLNVSVYMPVAKPRLIVFPVPLWRVGMSLHVSKRLKDLSAVAVKIQ